MTNIQITVTGARVEAALDGLLTGGMKGVPVVFTFDESWDELEKTALFRAGGSTFVCPVTEEMTVPWEVLQKAGCTLLVGLYGLSADGTVATPTLWASVGQIQPGADPEGTPAAAPTLPMWKQAMDSADSAMTLARQVYEAAEKGGFNGYSPVLGLDYWTSEDQAQIVAQAQSGAIGDIALALEHIITIQNALIGGDGA